MIDRRTVLRSLTALGAVALLAACRHLANGQYSRREVPGESRDGGGGSGGGMGGSY